MKNLLALVLMALSFTHFRRDLFSRSLPNQAIEREWRKRMKKKKRYQNRKYKKPVLHLPKHFKLKGSAAKDHRFSNQKRLRRMFRNC